MDRRDFIALAGGFAAAPLALPRVGVAQQTQPVIGWLSSISEATTKLQVEAFRQALSQAGFDDRRNIRIESRWAEGRYERLPAMASDLVARNVSAIVTTGGEPSAAAARAATSTIPIVALLGGDPMKLGLFASLNRPGGNATGISIFANAMESKRFGLLHEVLPGAKSIAVLANPANPVFDLQVRDIDEAKARLGVEAFMFTASTDAEIDAAFSTIEQRKFGGLLICGDPFFNSRRARLVALAAQHRLPAIYEWREFALEGGLMSYGTILADAYRQAGVYAARILKGEKPADLPVMQATKFEFVINLKTAKQLGLAFSPTVLARADEAIE